MNPHSPTCRVPRLPVPAVARHAARGCDPVAFKFRRRAVAAMTSLLLAACSGSAPTLSPVPAGATVLALGDSLTWGTGATPETSWPTVLAAATGWNVVNAGVPGETAAQGCARLPALIDEGRPALLLVMLGGNDFLRRAPAAAVERGLATCVDSARAAKLPLVLLTVPQPALTGATETPLYQRFGKAAGVPVVESGLAGLLRDAAKRADPVHLNAEGYRELAANIRAGLVALGALRS
jgi:acyl-CoA thioesterase-1